MNKYIVLALISTLSFQAEAGLHKWVDAEGKVHYSDTRPNEDVETQAVRNVAGKDSVSAPNDAAPKSLAEREADLKKAKKEKADADAKQAQKDAQSEMKKSNCTAARNNERTLLESPNITTYDSKGEKVLMDEAAREKSLAEARKAISENCE